MSLVSLVVNLTEDVVAFSVLLLHACLAVHAPGLLVVLACLCLLVLSIVFVLLWYESKLP